MKGPLPTMPIGNFPTTIPGAHSITIVPQTAQAFSIVLFYSAKDHHHTVTLCADGRLIGTLPRRLSVTKQQLLRELRRIAASRNGNGGGPAPVALFLTPRYLPDPQLLAAA